jgi:hypothetical protein
MKILRFYAPWLAGIATALALTVACASAVHTSTPDSRVTVDWTNPADFVEVRENPGSRPARPEEWLAQLARHLQSRAERVLPPGQHLHVTITDVKRAGRYEPWRGPQWDDIRIIKDIYPPRIDLRYTLTGSDGTRLREGERTLRDLAFLSRGTLSRDDPLRYEKRLLDDWLRREFAPPRARPG